MSVFRIAPAAPAKSWIDGELQRLMEVAVETLIEVGEIEPGRFYLFSNNEVIALLVERSSTREQKQSAMTAIAEFARSLAVEAVVSVVDGYIPIEDETRFAAKDDRRSIQAVCGFGISAIGGCMSFAPYGRDVDDQIVGMCDEVQQRVADDVEKSDVYLTLCSPPLGALHRAVTAPGATFSLEGTIRWLQMLPLLGIEVFLMGNLAEQVMARQIYGPYEQQGAQENG
jgi:hypothetical protein